MYYVYILKGNKYYCGYTHDLDQRLFQHKNQETYTTQRIGQFQLVGFFSFGTKKEAIDMERKIKKGGHIERFLLDSRFQQYL